MIFWAAIKNSPRVYEINKYAFNCCFELSKNQWTMNFELELRSWESERPVLLSFQKRYSTLKSSKHNILPIHENIRNFSFFSMKLLLLRSSSEAVQFQTETRRGRIISLSNSQILTYLYTRKSGSERFKDKCVAIMDEHREQTNSSRRYKSTWVLFRIEEQMSNWETTLNSVTTPRATWRCHKCQHKQAQFQEFRIE